MNRRTLSSRIAFLDGYTGTATFVEPTLAVRDCRDPRDNNFREAALAGAADLILTGDQDLLVLHPWRGVSILTPSEYLERIR